MNSPIARQDLSFGLTTTRLEARQDGLGGSDARVIMSGDDEALFRLWQEKRGEAQPDDLSDSLPVVMGLWTEELNRLWYTRRTGRGVTEAGKSVVHPRHDFILSDLDGLTTTEAGAAAVFEAKHVNPFNFDVDGCVAKYQPQLQHKMMVTGLPFAVLSVFVGTLRWECEEIPADLFYQATLLEREIAFWAAVKDGKPPCAMPAVEAPKRTEPLRTVHFDRDNEWAALAADWREHREAAGKFTAAEKGLKEKVEPDVGLAHGHGVVIKRDKAGRLRISAEK
jgi:predicted phage-related endonuclease